MALDGSRAGFYRSRGAEVRGIAETCRDPAIKDQLETVARQYEDLAASVEQGMLGR